MKTTLCATIGPASSSPEVLEEMLRQGMTVARFNLAHGTHSAHQRAFETLTGVVKKMGALCAVVVSLAGDNVRTGEAVRGGAPIDAKQHFEWYCTAQHAGLLTDSTRGYVNCVALLSALQRDDLLVVDDGKMQFRVVEVLSDRVLCVAVTSGTIGSRKRVLCPTARFPRSFLEEVERRELADLKWAAELGADFVDSSGLHDRQSRAVLCEAALDAGVALLSRVEDRLSLDAELGATQRGASGDGCIAGTLLLRSLLGARVDVASVPGAQRALAGNALRRGRPLLVCSDMLGSMMRSKQPSRADATDVHNAVKEGAFGILLTHETATGQYPAQAVHYAGTICAETERNIDYRAEYIAVRRAVKPPIDAAASLASSAALCARDVQAECVLLIDPSEELSLAVAKFRSCEVIHVVSDRKWAHRQLLLRGRTLVLMKEEDLAKASVDDILSTLRKEKFVSAAQGKIIVVSKDLQVR